MNSFLLFERKVVDQRTISFTGSFFSLFEFNEHGKNSIRGMVYLLHKSYG